MKGAAMPEEFEGDLAGAVFWGADLSGARFRDVNLTDVRISHAWLVNVDIDALIDRVVINGVDVTTFVNERDAWYPLRSMLRPSTPEGMRAAWAALEAEWAKTIARAQALPEAKLHESVNGEWTFVQTLRHLVFAMDKWFTVPIGGQPSRRSGCRTPGPSTSRGPVSIRVWRRLSRRRSRARADRAGRLRDYLAIGGRGRLRSADRGARERHEPTAGVHLHRLRGRVLAQPLRAPRPRAAAR